MVQPLVITTNCNIVLQVLDDSSTELQQFFLELHLQVLPLFRIVLPLRREATLPLDMYG